MNAYLTMIVSPRNSCRVSIVAGLRVATRTQFSTHTSILVAITPTRVIIGGCLIDDEAVGPAH